MPYFESVEKKNPDVDFRVLEVWHNETNSAHQRLLEHKVGQTITGVPEVIIGNLSLLGVDQIEKGLEPAILLQRGNLTGASQVAAIPVTGSPSTPDTIIPAQYFYGNGCSHCEKVTPIVDEMAARYPNLRIERLEINDNTTNRARFLAVIGQYGRGGSIPSFVIGNRFLTGETEVSGQIEEAIRSEEQRVAQETPAPTPGTAGTPSSSANVSVDAAFFYSDTCSHCEKVKPVILNVSARYPDLNLTWYEINHNADNRQLLIDLSNRHGIPNPGVPTVFIGNTVLVGEGDVTDRFESAFLAERQRLASCANASPVNETAVNATCSTPATAFSPLMVVFGALVDSTNPCGLSVLVFLLISMVAAGDRRRILLAGGVYIAAMFLFHLFVGIGLFSAFSLSGLAKPFSILGGLIALILGIITLADVVRNRETYLLSIPESGKGMLGTYIRKATLPGAFILGIMAGVLGFTCTGGIYISILGLMGRQMTFLSGLPWLILYNLIYVLPLVILTLLVAYGISPERADRWRTENKRAIRVVIGVILVGLGVVILSGWMG